MIAILHTWGQNLSLHPHLHCIIPGGGIDANGKWKRKIKTDKYLFAVKALSKVFRAKFVALLRKEKLADAHVLQSLFRSEEHTSELQSRPHLVCRLLLEKKQRTDSLRFR